MHNLTQVNTNKPQSKLQSELSLLLVSHCNTESYEPNVAICQYLTNRCIQSNLNCLRKLNDFLNHKLHREFQITEFQTQSIAKFNLSILLILAGKRDNALPIIREVYDTRNCFITFMQSRILLLLLELNVNLKNSSEVLQIYGNFPLKQSNRNKNISNQWISLIVYEHNKSHHISSEQFYFMSNVFISQALMQLNLNVSVLPLNQQYIDLQSKLLTRIYQRKNNINKYYQINIIMINRFLEAQRQLHAHNINKSLALMHFNNIQQQLQKMPTTKIITNILNSLAISNTGLIHFHKKKIIVSFYYFHKAKNLLSKCCTGVQQKDLQLFSTNYSNHMSQINYNIALILLQTGSPQAYHTYNSLKKGNQSCHSYQFWYRMGQSALQYVHHHPKLETDLQNSLLQQALSAFNRSLLALRQYRFPTMQMRQYFQMLSEEQFEQMILRYRKEYENYRQSILVLICYCSLCLGLFHRVIKIANQLLNDNKLQSEYRIQLIYYLLETYSQMSQNDRSLVQYWLNMLQKQTQIFKQTKCRIMYSNGLKKSIQWTDYQSILYHRLCIHMLHINCISQASNYAQQLRIKAQLKPSCSLICLLEYLNQIIGFGRKSMQAYTKAHAKM